MIMPEGQKLLDSYAIMAICTRSSVDRASDFGSEGREFESCRVRHQTQEASSHQYL
jgi:hypothetical protein